MTGYPSKKKAAQDKVTDIDGHVVRDVRKPRKLPQRPWVDHEPDGRRAAQKFIEAENKKVSERYGYVPKLHPSEWQDKLAQPAQDSNWAWACNECGAQEFTSALSEADLDYLACSNCGGNEFHKEALAQTAQEPVAKYSDIVSDGGLDPRNTTPPQRPWVELEGEEIRNLWEEAAKPDRSTVTIVTSFARAIEAKLKEKNT